MALIINIKNSRHSPLVQVGRATLKGHLIENVPRITCSITWTRPPEAGPLRVVPFFTVLLRGGERCGHQPAL